MKYIYMLSYCLSLITSVMHLAMAVGFTRCFPQFKKMEGTVKTIHQIGYTVLTLTGTAAGVGGFALHYLHLVSTATEPGKEFLILIGAHMLLLLWQTGFAFIIEVYAASKQERGLSLVETDKVQKHIISTDGDVEIRTDHS